MSCHVRRAHTPPRACPCLAQLRLAAARSRFALSLTVEAERPRLSSRLSVSQPCLASPCTTTAANAAMPRACRCRSATAYRQAPAVRTPTQPPSAHSQPHAPAPPSCPPPERPSPVVATFAVLAAQTTANTHARPRPGLLCHAARRLVAPLLAVEAERPRLGLTPELATPPRAMPQPSLAAVSQAQPCLAATSPNRVAKPARERQTEPVL